MFFSQLYSRLAVLIFGVVIGFSPFAQTPPRILVVAPPAGPPGSTTSLIDANATMTGLTCFAQIAGRASVVGLMAGQLAYTIPADLAPGTEISFYCGSSSGAQLSSVGIFVVVPPPVVDTDGDGLNDPDDNCPTVAGPRDNGGCPAAPPADRDGDSVPDDADGCPDQPGPRDNNGCPVPVDPGPTDSDGDGIPDSADACPNQPGLPEANGCAPSPLPPADPAVEPPAPPLPEIALPQLPASGPCMVATQSATAVNIRAEASTNAAVVGSLDPMQLYAVIGQTPDGTWLQIAEGWVATWVTRQGGDCGQVPAGDAPPPPLAQPNDGAADDSLPKLQEAVANGTFLSDCPELVSSVDALPNFLVLAISGAPDPCAAAGAEIDELFFNPPAQAGGWSFPDCGAGGEQYEPGQSVYVDLLNHTSGATRDYLDSLRNDDILFCALILDLYLGIVTDYSFPADEHVLPVAIAYCELGFGESDSMLARMEAIDLHPQYLRTLYHDCTLFTYLRELGSIPSSNVAYFKLLVENCGVGVADAGLRAFWDAVRGALDAAAAANQGCAGFDLLYDYPLPLDLQPLVPDIAAGDSDCTGHYRMLATHNASLGAETVYRILKSVDPCDAASEYTYSGGVPLNVVPPPECIQGDQMVLGAAQFNQTVIDKSSSWFTKITAIDRPLDEMCAQTAQLGPGGAFANPPTATMGAFAANPTPTPPVLVANPTATLPAFVANPTPTATPSAVVPVEAGIVPDVEDPEEPPVDPPLDNGLPGAFVANPSLPSPTATADQAADGQTEAQDDWEQPVANDPEPPPLQGDNGELPPPDGAGSDPAAGQSGGVVTVGSTYSNCFGCIPSGSVLPGGRAGSVFVGANADDGTVALFVLPPYGEISPETGETELIPVPLGALPEPLAGYPVLLSADGRYIGYFARAVDPATLSAEARHVMVSLPDGLTAASESTEEVAFYYNRIAFQYSSTRDGKDFLEPELVLHFPAGLTPAPDALQWLPDGSGVVLSLTDAGGQTSIYRLSGYEYPGEYAQRFDGVEPAASVTPELLVENASAPSLAPSGRYLAFVRDGETGRNIHALALNSLREDAITVPDPGTECYRPRFAGDSLTIYFTCQAGGAPQMYRYGLSGINPINTGIENAQNPTPGDANGTIYFDDGGTLYLSADDGSGAIPYIEFKLTNAQVTSYNLSVGG